MPSQHIVEMPGRKAPVVPPRPLGERLLLVLWPAFLMAGVLEMLTFAVVDPSSLHWFGADPIDWSRSAVYSVTFFIYWGVITLSGLITQLLESPGPPPMHE